jgi:hypothetical protein
MTGAPARAKAAATGRPTYPRPTTDMLRVILASIIGSQSRFNKTLASEMQKHVTVK